MNNILEKVNLYLGTENLLNEDVNEGLLLTIVETLDDMGISLNREQQKTLLSNISERLDRV